MKHIDTIHKYFDLFSKKDLDAIQDLFSKDVTLIDWDIKVEGFQATVQAFHNIFNSVEVIDVTIKHIFGNDLEYSCLIEIDIDNLATLKVVDIITLNEEGFIESINAYKQ